MKSLILFIMLGMSSAFCFGQADNAANDSIPAKSTLTLAAVYANDASYYGQKALQKNPYVAVAANYQLKSGFYFTAQSYKLLNDNTSSVSAAAVGAGVNFKLGKKLTTDLSYSHSFYPSYSPLLQAANVDNASLVFSYDSWIKPSLTGDYAFGKTSDAFVTGGLSKSINLFSISQKDIVTVSPSADLVAGTQHFYQTYITQKKLHDSILGIAPIPVLGNSSSSSHADTVATTSFNLLSYNFKIPLAYNRSHYVLQAEYQLSLLSNHVAAAEKVNSFLTFSFYYQF
ncbi:MAG TPA: porin [Hanamia sp.]|nr:porin [Hanamia sp.]